MPKKETLLQRSVTFAKVRFRFADCANECCVSAPSFSHSTAMQLCAIASIIDQHDWLGRYSAPTSLDECLSDLDKFDEIDISDPVEALVYIFLRGNR